MEARLDRGDAEATVGTALMRGPVGVGVVAAGAAVAALAFLALGATGCGAPTPEAVAQERGDIASRGAVTVQRDLQQLVDRLYGAADLAEEALARTPAVADAPFEALAAALRASDVVAGLVWEGPGAEAAWAGRTVDALPSPAPPAWEGSFRAGDIAFHNGPFLRALIVGPTPVRGGALTATGILEERPAGAGPGRPFAGRWLDPLGLEHVRLLPPTSTPAVPDGAEAFLVHAPTGVPVLRGIVVPPGARAVQDRLEQRKRTAEGVLLLVLWLAGVALAFGGTLRRVAPGAPRWILLGGVVLLARGGLAWLHLPERFPGLEPAFRPSDFGIAEALGWLGSPGDFALSALAALIAGACFSAAVRVRPTPPGRPRRSGIAWIAWGACGAGVGCAAAAPAVWLAVVAVAVAQGQTDFFAVPSIVPSLPAGLMLTGLLATTAAAWTVTTAALVLAASAWQRPPPRRVTLLTTGVATALAFLLARGAGPAWAVPLLPLTALPVLLTRPADERRVAPSRILVVGVLATILLFPLLWIRVGERRALRLAATLNDLMGGEAVAVSGTYLDLETLRYDPTLRATLEEARNGPVPEGVAFAVWLRSFLAQPDARGLVSILDAEGRRLDSFTLTPLPADRIPTPAPPTADAGDLQVAPVRSEAASFRCVVGRLRIRDESGEPLGVVVFTVPDPIDLALAGIGGEEGAEAEAGGPGRVGPERLQYAILRRGRVDASSDGSISRRAGSFGPPALSTLGPESPAFAWREDGYEGHALWSWDRDATVAVRRRAAGPAAAVLAMARLVAVGVGLAGLAALGAFLVGLPRLRPRLHHRILLSYFAISVIPLILLGWASARDARARHDAYLSRQLATDIGRARSDLEAMGAQVFDRASDAHLLKWANQRRHDVFLYRGSEVFATSRPGLIEAETLPARLPADAYRATVEEHREIVRREASFAGRPVWFGYAPVLDARGRTSATVGVPLLYDQEGVREDFAVTGSVLLAGYLLTLVLVLVGGIYAARRLARPLSQLATGTRRVAEGRLDVRLEGEGKDELGELVRAFNTMTRELEKVTAKAARAEREMAWQRMARQVAHEIKNPLTPIRLMIQQMEADVARDPANAEEAIRRTAPVVLKQIETLRRIANDFSHFARMPRRALEDVDVSELVRDVVGLYGGSQQTGIDVTCTIAEELPPVHWDGEELRRILVNLVGNAVQSIPGEGAVRVAATRERRDDREGVRIDVEDTGEGISEENRERIFEPDFSTKPSGTGLGLAIVRRTVDDLGGRIVVESEPGQGSTFRLWLPAADRET